VSSFQAKHALLRTSERVTDSDVATADRYYVSLRFFVLAASHLADGHMRCGSTHDHYPLPLSNSVAMPPSRAARRN
jgi:hypothetical protein